MTNSLRYGPGTLRVSVGETVTWRNTSDLIHTVTADPEKAMDVANVRLPEGAETFDSGNLRPGETFSHTFRVPGEYVYFCIPHEAAGMVGRIVVSP
ncbi:MAG: copper-binding protein [Gemmatimonadetes bacterium]|nr:copper-binding protein [Gemmatimonadota bacterium]NIR77968.1 copper-binding protein [Gemmatimonadota bacterium]NIT86504.1 copper-binding protein [Gemmatimonadota bacterium]NIU30363.1 copper-binding protein [Gemmatimonadota bacterium]NIU35248.1 copper-binding protein [Gemmatimonadota bacterium]